VVGVDVGAVEAVAEGWGVAVAVAGTDEDVEAAGVVGVPDGCKIPIPS
jgi:hypothetical protein